MAYPRLFKSFEFENESRISDEDLVILEFKYLQNKKWYKQALKSARINKSYWTYWLFSFHSDNLSKITIFLQKMAIFNICQAPWFLQAVWRQERNGLSDSKTFQPQGGYTEKTRKKREILAFSPLLQEIRLKDLTSRKIFWSSYI